MQSTLKILHTSEWHLGAAFKSLGPRGAQQRQRLREAAVEIAAGQLFPS